MVCAKGYKAPIVLSLIETLSFFARRAFFVQTKKKSWTSSPWLGGKQIKQSRDKEIQIKSSLGFAVSDGADRLPELNNGRVVIFATALR